MNNINGPDKLIDKEIAHCLGYLSVGQKKVVLTLVKSFARKENAWADDKAHIAEIDKRFNELDSGKVMGLNLEDLTARAKKLNKSSKRKKA